MPAWAHKYTNMSFRTNILPKPCQCLRRNHKIRTIEDLLAFVSREHHNNEDADCECKLCTRDREKGCETPLECIGQAERILNKLPKEWDPREIPEDTREPEDEDGPYTFKTPKKPTEIEDTFRITFTKTRPKVTISVPSIGNKLPFSEDETVVYTDGSCMRNGEENSHAGSGIWFRDGDERNRSYRLPRELGKSNQAGEIVAVIQALRLIHPETPVLIKSDSKYTIEALTKNLRKNEDIGWTGISNAHLFRLATVELRKRRAKTSFEWVKGHSGEKGNEGADEQAKNGCAKESPDKINNVEKFGINPQGIKLRALTRSLAYRALKAEKLKK
jgi:ribonuclease HI